MQISNRSIDFPGWLQLVIVFLLAGSMITPNPMLTFYSIAVVAFLVKLLWKKGEPPVLLFIVFIQWLQASTKVFHANIYNASLETFSSIKYIEEAIFLSLTGLLVLGIAMNLAVRNIPPLNFYNINAIAKRLNINKLIKLYFISLIIVLGLSYVRSVLPALSQIILAIQNIKWIIIFILVFTSLVKKEKSFYVFVVFCIELLIGLTGYFAGFKTIFFFLLIATTTVKYRLSFNNMIPVGIALSTMILFMVLWTSIKSDYRNFLSKGEKAQIIVVTPDQQFLQLTRLVTELDYKQFSYSIDLTLQRISYVDYFGHVLEYVPGIKSHEYGNIWFSAIQHILVPRFIFPAKQVLPSDSELTMEYTGLRLASFAQGSSISIGYMGESYIDFGRAGMFVPIFILGYLWGRFYTHFITRSSIKVIGFAFAVAVLINAYQLEMNSTKLLGSMIMQFIILAVLFRMVEFKLYRWLII